MEEETKPISISKRLIYESYKEVSGNKGASGVDGQTLLEFEKDLRKNLYKLWNRMSSGSYFPQPVKEVLIPKSGGGKRPLGIPTVTDRIAQTVVKKLIEPRIDKVFHVDSYGYRPKKSAHDALKACRKRCWQTNWVVDIDIKGYFDNIDHQLLLKAFERHVKEKWVLLYVKRWLTTSVKRNGEIEEREKGTPQGGVISPLLANLFLHYVFDKWISKHYPNIKFERYADDIVIHTHTQEESEKLLNRLKLRFEQCKLEMHPTKSKIVYCKDCKRIGDYPVYSFDFLGFTFRPRLASNKKGMYYTGFLGSISRTGEKSIRRRIRSWKLHRQSERSLQELAEHINPQVRGWINYYSLFSKRGISRVLVSINRRILKWIRMKYKLTSKRQVLKAFKLHRHRSPKLFAHWAFLV